MNRKLVLLNGVLLVVVIYGGVQLRNEYQAAKARGAALRAVRISPAPTPPFVALPNDPPVLPSGYKDVAMKDLFHPSRNPDVPVELPPPPPPPPPMPEVPRYHGQMNLGDGPMALLVEKAGMADQTVFSDELIREIHVRSQGIPRLINTLCDNLLLTAFAVEQREASLTMLDEICRDIRLEWPGHNLRPRGESLLSTESIEHPLI